MTTNQPTFRVQIVKSGDYFDHYTNVGGWRSEAAATKEMNRLHSVGLTSARIITR